MDVRSINTVDLSHGSLHVRIIKVESPTLLWVQLYHARENLEELLDDLTHRMTRKSKNLICNPDYVLPDECVAVREGKTWQRGVIINLADRTTATIALRDWGRVIRRPISEIYILEDKFRELNWQSIPCGLAHLCPVGSRSRWSRKSRALTKLLLGQREGWMRILEPIQNHAAVITLELKRESEDEMSSLKEMLIATGCAQHTDEKIVSAIPGIL
ncbi:Tudor domain-containing protein 5 [Cyphomyrmex costatus]|uniref:Tudor domain-containing protein 5 n=1 Tax=Cyphomyrmex costatus TaxID=456900 RepID=A0A151IQT1_9HYME|nr:Tudor domain-containing protein 5 [Cyphomyrmex costatus]